MIQKFIDFLDDPFGTITAPIFTALGKLYLTARYPSKEKRAEIFQTDFENSYELVVKLKIVQFILFIIGLAMFGGLIFLVIQIIRGEIS